MCAGGGQPGGGQQQEGSGAGQPRHPPDPRHRRPQHPHLLGGGGAPARARTEVAAVAGVNSTAASLSILQASNFPPSQHIAPPPVRLQWILDFW